VSRWDSLLRWSECHAARTIATERAHDAQINGEVKQDGPTVRRRSARPAERAQSDMMFDIPRLIEHCSSIMTLEEGDSILTGTVRRRRAARSVLAHLHSRPA